MAGGLGSRQIVHYYFGRANNLRPSLVATLNNFKDGEIGLSRIVALRERFMPVRIERLADDCLTLDAMLAEQLLQLLQCHLHTLMKLRGVTRRTGGQSTFEIVNYRQKFNDERVLLCGSAGLAFLPAAPLKILKVCGQTKMQILLFGEVIEECLRFAGSGRGGGGVGLRSSRERAWLFRINRLALF